MYQTSLVRMWPPETTTTIIGFHASAAEPLKYITQTHTNYTQPRKRAHTSLPFCSRGCIDIKYYLVVVEIYLALHALASTVFQYENFKSIWRHWTIKNITFVLFSQNCFVNNTKHCIVFTKKKIFFTVCYFHEIFWFVIYTGNGIRLGFSSTTTTSCFSHQAELRSCSSIRCRTCCCSWRRGRPGGSSRWWRWWPRQQSTRPSSILSSRRAWLHSRDCALLRLFEENLKLHLWKPLELVYIVQCIYM